MNRTNVLKGDDYYCNFERNNLTQFILNTYH
ncbi:hypothetical protein DYBT9275_03947 [Dyadobacter sp. CECT 9275]|uniref:Uncharacterized protein n=1 Tax=Dyadobacter helix TaxID=2822344 RepID=A0A916JFT5_9BACT|nr:hypothetical protein DYBT9275_03947 [Dyadobacter sp. CECT 9275]